MAKHEPVYSNTLAPYFKSINPCKGLSREKEAELGKRIQEGDTDAIHELVEANLQFVVRTAKKYYNSGIPMEDLISEGNFGLYKAAKKFDYTKGKKFITYAVWWIKAAIQEYIKECKGQNDEVSMDEYMNIKDNDQADYNESADALNNEYEEKLTEIQSRGMAIDELMECLQERESQILTLYFGLHGEKQMNLKEISDEMQISSERVRQIVNTSLTKMKASALSGNYFDEYKNLI